MASKLTYVGHPYILHKLPLNSSSGCAVDVSVHLQKYFEQPLTCLRYSVMTLAVASTMFLSAWE